MIEETKLLINSRFINCVEELKNRNLINSYKDFCEAVGILPQSFNDIKGNRRSVTIDIIYNTCDTYNINIEYVFYGFGEMIKYVENLENLHNSNNSVKKENEVENQKILDKSNKTENEEYHKSYHNDYHTEEKEQGRLEDKQEQYNNKSIQQSIAKPSKSEYFDFLKKEIAFKNKIIENLLQSTMIKEEDIEAKVRQALRKNEDKPLITIVSKVEKEVLKTAKTKEEEKLIADIFVRILTRLSEED